ncbi:hypothetical protein V8F06_005893 [Rhypophila decipiens]
MGILTNAVITTFALLLRQARIANIVFYLLSWLLVDSHNGRHCGISIKSNHSSVSNHPHLPSAAQPRLSSGPTKGLSIRKLREASCTRAPSQTCGGWTTEITPTPIRGPQNAEEEVANLQPARFLVELYLFFLLPLLVHD